MMRRALGLMAIAIWLFCAASRADTSGNDISDIWKNECIGRYQISVPSDIEVALTLTEKLVQPYDVFIGYKFNDGGDAPYSRLITESGEMYVTSILGNGVFDNLKIEIKKQRLQRIKELREDGEMEDAESIKVFKTDSPNKYIWVAKSGATILIQNDGRVFQLSGGIKNKTGTQFVETFLEHFHVRALHEQPKLPGLCIPYGFIADDGKQPHEIAVTMRLLDHPDIEVALRDSTYTENNYRDGKSIQAFPDPKEAINYFFANSGITNADEKEEVNFPGYHSVEMNGQKGGAVFITITRKDGSKDYGYVAAVQGTADTPSLLLYVIRTASRAKGKPVSKGELKDMAEKIVASIKRHAVQ